MGGPRIVLAAVAALSVGGCETLRRERVEAAPAPPDVVAMPPVLVELEPPAGPPPPARACVPRGLAPPPRYPDTDQALRAAPGAADRYQLMAAGRLLRQRRLEELERVIAGCR